MIGVLVTGGLTVALAYALGRQLANATSQKKGVSMSGWETATNTDDPETMDKILAVVRKGPTEPKYDRGASGAASDRALDSVLYTLLSAKEPWGLGFSEAYAKLCIVSPRLIVVPTGASGAQVRALFFLLPIQQKKDMIFVLADYLRSKKVPATDPAYDDLDARLRAWSGSVAVSQDGTPSTTTTTNTVNTGRVTVGGPPRSGRAPRGRVTVGGATGIRVTQPTRFQEPDAFGRTRVAGPGPGTLAAPRTEYGGTQIFLDDPRWSSGR